MPVDKIKYLGACIRTARKHCGLTQQELADQSGVSVKTIRNIETGKMNPSYEILFPIINRLGLSTSDLFNVSPDEQEEEIQRFIWKIQGLQPDKPAYPFGDFGLSGRAVIGCPE